MTPAKREPDTTTYAGRFAARLRELRQAAGLTQKEAAERLDLPQQTLSRWETGERVPSLRQYPAIAKIYGDIPAEKFFPEF